MKKINFIFGLIFFFTMMQSEIFGEEIVIDSTFNTSCEIFPFGEIGMITSLSLTADYHRDYDLSEQQVISCSNPDHSSCVSGYIDSALIFIRDTGVVTEACCEYTETDPLCWLLDICEDPDTVKKFVVDH